MCVSAPSRQNDGVRNMLSFVNARRSVLLVGVLTVLMVILLSVVVQEIMQVPYGGQLDLLDGRPQQSDSTTFAQANNIVYSRGGVGGSGGAQSSQYCFGETDRPDIYDLADELIDIVISSIEPDQWWDNGGLAASIRFYKGSLIVLAPPYVHRQVKVLLDDLKQNDMYVQLTALSVDRLACGVFELLEKGEITQAGFLVTWMMINHPDFPFASRINVILSDKELSSDERKESLEVERSELEENLLELARQRSRTQLLRNKLDSALLKYANDSSLPTQLEENYQGLKPTCADWLKGGIRAVITVNGELNAECVEILQSTGLLIERESKPDRLVIAIVPLGQFDELALIQCVARVEPFLTKEDSDE